MALKFEQIETFEKLHTQIDGVYAELCILSKKSPDGAINQFKLKLINQIIASANELLGEPYKPFNDFVIFNDEDLPTNSDVAFIISQYIKCLEKLKFDNIERSGRHWCWRGGSERITSSPARELYL